jgi:ethanolamine ammonia-lyase small subunit
MEKHNGWTNYATWRVNLEMFDGLSALDVTGEVKPTQQTLSEGLQSMAYDMIEESSPVGFARSYALSFLDDVNWWEIAGHILENELEEA